MTCVNYDKMIMSLFYSLRQKIYFYVKYTHSEIINTYAKLYTSIFKVVYTHCFKDYTRNKRSYTEQFLCHIYTDFENICTDSDIEYVLILGSNMH
jgi:UDP-2,3-diacylglucosamine pyrophosphatase LpxH